MLDTQPQSTPESTHVSESETFPEEIRQALEALPNVEITPKGEITLETIISTIISLTNEKNATKVANVFIKFADTKYPDINDQRDFFLTICELTPQDNILRRILSKKATEVTVKNIDSLVANKSDTQDQIASYESERQRKKTQMKKELAQFLSKLSKNSAIAPRTRLQ